RQVAVMQEQLRTVCVRVDVDVVDPVGVETARPPDDPVDLIPLRQQELREIGAILPGDTGDQCPFHDLSRLTFLRPADTISAMRIQIRDAVNKLLRPLGLRMVSTRWGPRGPWDALRRAAAQGVIPNQIVDVGASNGIWTRECLRIFPNSRYFLV